MDGKDYRNDEHSDRLESGPQYGDDRNMSGDKNEVMGSDRHGRRNPHLTEQEQDSPFPVEEDIPTSRR